MLVEYFLIGAILDIVFLIVLTQNPATGILLQQFLPQDFSDKKTLHKTLLGIFIAWPAMIAYVIVMYRSRK